MTEMSLYSESNSNTDANVTLIKTGFPKIYWRHLKIYYLETCIRKVIPNKDYGLWPTTFQDLISLNYLVPLSEVISLCVCSLCGMIIGKSS